MFIYFLHTCCTPKGTDSVDVESIKLDGSLHLQVGLEFFNEYLDDFVMSVPGSYNQRCASLSVILRDFLKNLRIVPSISEQRTKMQALVRRRRWNSARSVLEEHARARVSIVRTPHRQSRDSHDIYRPKLFLNRIDEI